MAFKCQKDQLISLVFQQIFPVFLWLPTPLCLFISVIALLFSFGRSLLPWLETTMTRKIYQFFSKDKLWKHHFNSFFIWRESVFDLYWIGSQNTVKRWNIWIGNGIRWMEYKSLWVSQQHFSFCAYYSIKNQRIKEVTGIALSLSWAQLGKCHPNGISVVRNIKTSFEGCTLRF